MSPLLSFSNRCRQIFLPSKKVRLSTMGTRQFIDKTTHRHGFWRQFIDTIEDNSSTLFEDNSSTHYYLAIIPKLIKWRQCFSIKVIYYHVYDQNNEFRILIPYFWFLIQFQIPFKPHTTAGANKLTHCIFNVWYTWNFLKTFLIKTKVDGKWSWIFVYELFCHLFPNFLMFEL